jgi:hypothetical protein
LSHRSATRIGFLVVLLAGAPAYADDAPVPPGSHVEYVRSDLYEGAGYAMLAVWAANASVAAVADAVCGVAGGCTDHSYDWIYLPIAGPAIAAAMPAVQQYGVGWQVLLVADSAIQVGLGVTALVSYFFRSRRVIVPSTGVSFVVSPGVRGAPLGMTLTLTTF